MPTNHASNTAVSALSRGERSVAIALVPPSAPSHNAPPLISKVEHFFVLSADAEKLFRFFKEDIGYQ